MHYAYVGRGRGAYEDVRGRACLSGCRMRCVKKEGRDEVDENDPCVAAECMGSARAVGVGLRYVCVCVCVCVFVREKEEREREREREKGRIHQ